MIISIANNSEVEYTSTDVFFRNWKYDYITTYMNEVSYSFNILLSLQMRSFRTQYQS